MTDPSTDVEAGGWNRMVSARGGIRSTTAHVTGLALLFISLGMLLSAVVEFEGDFAFDDHAKIHGIGRVHSRVFGLHVLGESR